MKNIKVIIVVNVIFIALIIAAFIPALKSSDEGYKAKTSNIASEDVADNQASSVSVMEDKVEDITISEKPVVNESTSTSTVETVATKDEPKTAQSVTPTDEQATSTAVEGLYSVVDGNKLDEHSYAGYKIYRTWCAACHGTYGQGMIGPDLAESLTLISREQFDETVENGKTGPKGVMPPWKTNAKVMENRDQLYAYLKARSDGAIGVEKPKKQ